MLETPLRILQVSTADRLGGAEGVALNLFEAYRSRGYASTLAVGRRRTHDPDIYEIRHDQSGPAWERFWWKAHHALQPIYGRFPGSKQLCKMTHRLAAPRGWLDARRGIEDFEYPGTWSLLDDEPSPHIIHCHNLHGSYFDLRALPELSRVAPLMMTLHDAWLLAGHCAHSLDCDRWRTGCGQCPALTIYPAIRKDATAENWRVKADIFAQTRLHVATPSHWLLERVLQSMLSPSIVDSRVIPNGVDLGVFKPADQFAVRESLSLPMNQLILVFSAFGTRANPFKDYATLESAVNLVAAQSQRPVLFLALGESGTTRRHGHAETRFIPRINQPADVARYYQAADVYIHASHADTFPNAILEALACGTPVVATAVGGIPEQVRSWPDVNATGILTPPRDAAAMASAIERLSWDHALRRELGCNAADDAKRRFDLTMQADAYLEWYRAILDRDSKTQSHTKPRDAVTATATKKMIPVA